jgi:hypothetical protein
MMDQEDVPCSEPSRAGSDYLAMDLNKVLIQGLIDEPVANKIRNTGCPSYSAAFYSLLDASTIL